MNATLTNSSYIGYSENAFDLITIMRCIVSTHFTLGFSLNCYIIFLLLSKSGAVDMSVIFLLNNAAAEILFSILSILYLVFFDNPRSTVIILFVFSFSTSMSARLLFLCCVCLERYLAVVHPVTFLRFKPLRYRVACSILVWICALVLGACACTSPFSPYKLMVIVHIIILVVEFFCCVSILKQLRHPGPRDMESEHSEMRAVKKKAFQIISINLLANLTQNIPVAISYSLENVLSQYDFVMVILICSTVHIFAGLVQPGFILHKAGKLSFIKCS